MRERALAEGWPIVVHVSVWDRLLYHFVQSAQNLKSSLVAQVVDDTAGRTLAAASSMESDVRTLDGDKSARARKVGELVAERARAAGVEAVVFDRGGNRYHGRVAALAEGAREGGLAF